MSLWCRYLYAVVGAAVVLEWIPSPACAQIADPAPELGKLNYADQAKIKTHCQFRTSGIAAYRRCMWEQLTELRQGLPDPATELGKLNYADQAKIKTHCQFRTSGIAAYRRCMWGELKSIGIRTPPTPTPTERSIVDQTPPSRAALPWHNEVNVSAAQKRLVALGYDPGPVDGVLGIKTVQAIEQLKSDYNLKWEGDLVEGFLAAIEDRERLRAEQAPQTAQPPFCSG